MKIQWQCVCLFVSLFVCCCFGDDGPSTVAMRGTVKIAGPSLNVAGAESLGSGLCLMHVVATNQGKLAGTMVIVTAAHVFEGIKGEKANLMLRRELQGRYVTTNHSIVIRKGTTNLWTKHPQVDVAAMLISWPGEYGNGIDWVPDFSVWDEERWRELSMAPGDEVLVLGFPHGLASSVGAFPVLRSGCIASFPLLPAREVKTFWVDMTVFPGNSGGPVLCRYLGRRRAGDFSGAAVDAAGVLGILIGDFGWYDQSGDYVSKRHRESLGIAVVVHGALVKETIDLALKAVR